MKRFKNNISPDSREYPFKGVCKKSVIIDPYTRLPDSNKIKPLLEICGHLSYLRHLCAILTLGKIILQKGNAKTKH